MKHYPTLRLSTLALALIALVATGCSGINASKSVSPLDFFLPGLLQNRPPAPVSPIQTNAVPALAGAGHVPLQPRPAPASPT